MSNKKNVLMICVDQLAATRLSLFGDAVAMTPTIDFLGESGLNFENTYSTCPICIPARRTLMTGMTPKSHGDRVYLDTLEMPPVCTMAEAFSNAGYQTFAVGKLHVYPQRNRIGFDDAIIMEEGRNEFGVYDDYQIWLGEQGYISDEFTHTIGNNTYYTRSWHLPEEAHPTTWATKEMMKFIKRKDPNKPSFFYISYPSPHPPLVPLQSYLDMFPLDEIQLPEAGNNWDSSPILDIFTSKGATYTDKEKKMALRSYYATCAHIDSQIRMLLGTLRESNMLEDTFVVFLADHGDMLFEHGCVGKRLFYEGSTHVPLIISGVPSLQYRDKNPVDTKQIASLEDVMPTLLDLCEIEIPETVDGISLISGPKREYLFGEITEGSRATRMIHDGRYKLIYYPCGNVIQLFDLETDKMESTDLSKMNEFAEIKNRLIEQLIKNLHGGDEKWVQNGKLVGFSADIAEDPVDFGLFNQRGTHWPPPGAYFNYGNIQK